MEYCLFVYNGLDSLSKLRHNLSEFEFYSIAYFYNEYDRFENIYQIEEDYNNIIIDITNVIYDNSTGRLLTERYISKLNELSNVYFCIESVAYLKLIKEFPLLFDDDSISQEYNIMDAPNPKQEQEIKRIEPKVLFTYEKNKETEKMVVNSSVTTLSNLIDDTEGIILNYNTQRIKKFFEQNKTEYIDISSTIQTLKIRQDQLLYFEKLFLQIIKVSNTNFCVEEKLALDTMNMFPFVFSNTQEFDLFEKKNEVEISEDENREIDISVLEDNIANISRSLKGHDNFKKDFEQKYLKFSFLNKMRERKIFSIIICGESGIGKTEFAKILSSELYPNSPLIKINFGNYSTEGVLNSLIGSPLGYVGSEEGGELIKKIESSKAKVILIDEFEKATPSVYNFFYELLEDGIFTDRHGVEHNLDGYIIVFTSNMSQSQYIKHIPDSLKSRFDMVYYFVDLPVPEKLEFIFITANLLIAKLKESFNVDIDINTINDELKELCQFNNLRDIKRKVEDIVFNEFFIIYKVD